MKEKYCKHSLWKKIHCRLWVVPSGPFCNMPFFLLGFNSTQVARAWGHGNSKCAHRMLCTTATMGSNIFKSLFQSWVQQLTRFDSWTLTAGILLNKVLFSLIKGPDYGLKLCIFSKESKYTAWCWDTSPLS